ncbi:MAG: hypothetical protein H6892_02950 [Brucellaceae bacterium]|nr:hypothetical protein [Brucellaceae bacterium]
MRVTAPPVFGRLHVAPAIRTFLEKWPEVSAEILLNDRYLDFIEHQLDVAVRIGSLPDSGLRARRAGTVQWLTVASPAIWRARANRATLPSSPAGRPLWNPGRWVAQLAISDRGQGAAGAARTAAYCQRHDIQLDAARAGRGIARHILLSGRRGDEAPALVRVRGATNR